METGSQISSGVDAGVVPRPTARPRRSEHPYYVGIAVLTIAIATIGFVPGLVSPNRLAAMTPLVGLHSALMVAWLGFYLTQTLLVANGRVALHRRLGVWGAVLAAVAVVTGLIASLDAAARGGDLSGDLTRWFEQRQDIAADLTFADLMALPFFDGLVFGLFVAAALVYRRRPAAHKRLMLFGVIGGLIAAPLVHIIGHFNASPVLFVLIPLMLVSSGINDKVTTGRVHPVSWVAPVLIQAFVSVRPGLLPVWRALVDWWAAT